MQHLQPNTTLQGGKYRIIRVLGQGGFGITYLATTIDKGAKVQPPKIAFKNVAIKELFIASNGQAINGRRGNQVTVTNISNQVTFDRLKEKFKKEASRLAALRHQNLVRVYDSFEENCTVYYVMDYIKGESLREKLNREGVLQESLVMNYLNQLISALQVVHQQNIWHLDIKPENIMVDKQDKVYLVDFGASKHIENSGTLTTSSMLSYTPGYFPPEQSATTMRNIGAWTDIYALGATLYNLLTKLNPPTFDVIISEGKDAFWFPPRVSQQARDLIIWMMKVNRKDRPQNVGELLIKIADGEKTRIGVNNNSSVDKAPVTNTSTYVEENSDYSKFWMLGLFVLSIIGWLVYDNMIKNDTDDIVISNPAEDNSSPKHAERPSSKKEVIQRLINNMVYVEGGTFIMGATSEQGKDAQYDEKPAHRVTLSSYSIGKYEVTQEEWLAVMDNNPSYFKGLKRPVERVSWNDCQEFIRKLNSITGKHFRLPTEAEWEYAARGGNRSSGYKYSGSNTIKNVAWYWEYTNSEKETHDVGQKTPNELGLYDMSGNVSELCSDWFNWYSSSQEKSQASSSGRYRVWRGGSYCSYKEGCRVSARTSSIPDLAEDFDGLRLAHDN